MSSLHVEPKCVLQPVALLIIDAQIAGEPHLAQPRADRGLASETGDTAGGGTILALPLGEDRALSNDAIDVRGAVAHDPHVGGADVEPTDVVTPENEKVGQRPFDGSVSSRGTDRKRFVLPSFCLDHGT
jgi:hypothetical protein